jgi:uncharacterized protein (TIGR03089 family)
VDGQGRPERVGLLMGLHWQAVCFLLGAAASGATVAVSSSPEGLAGCEVAFVDAERAEAALDAGVDEVIASSGHPLGARLAVVPPLVLDAAVEVPGHGDHFGGPYATAPAIELDGVPFTPSDLGLGPTDRVLTTLDPATPDGLGVLLSALRAGASLVLVRGDVDLGAVAAAERVTRVLTA